MNPTRRELLKTGIYATAGAIFAASFIAAENNTPSERQPMQHAYMNEEGEIIAANSLHQAWRFHDCELAGFDEKQGDWYEIDDGAQIPVGEEDGTSETKTAKEWASEHFEPGYIATTYF